MPFQHEWHQLRLKLTENQLSIPRFENQFYKRLLIVLEDKYASAPDIICAYRDALLSSPYGERKRLPLRGIDSDYKGLMKIANIRADRTRNEVSISDVDVIQSDDGAVILEDIYAQVKRRKIKKYSIDPSLESMLSDKRYKKYNGNTQQMSVRLALTSPDDSTLVINMPTGSGKTLVAHSLCAFSPPNKLTLVIVPTVGLSIEQGNRATKILNKMGTAHGGCYFWHGQQDEQIQNDIRERIVKGQQRILFCSPESACRSLLPVLFEAASTGILANIVVDEAHLIDQWGAEFRPYFQIFSAVFHSLRKVANGGVKCCLMSATFTEKTLNIIRDLFRRENEVPIEIHGSFLRPEIQYNVFCVSSESHQEEVVKAVVRLPKPLVVYTVTRVDAERIYNRLQSLGFARIGLFTGSTGPIEREKLLENWSKDKTDIMVATSAFGVGMDKDNVRSVLHAAIPENLDRFYQEVGRAGRDGVACQSLMIYHKSQFYVAQNINNQRLITEDLGLKKWKKMWNTGTQGLFGKRIIDIRTIHEGLPTFSDSNEEWNWRTLLLMQRAGMIEIEIEPPKPPEWDPELEVEENRSVRSKYYDDYYRRVVVAPLIDDHTNPIVWSKRIGQHREYEKISQKEGYKRLEQWVINSSDRPFCEELVDFYTVRKRQPEYVCGGCPGCRKAGRTSKAIATVGYVCHVFNVYPPKKWSSPIKTTRLHVPIYYSKKNVANEKKAIRQWIHWISEFIENGVITAVRAEDSTLALINKRMPSGVRRFWVGMSLSHDCDKPSYWSELVLIMPDASQIPDMGWEESPRLIVAPDDIPDKKHYKCAWWEKDNEAKSLDNFLSGL